MRVCPAGRHPRESQLQPIPAPETQWQHPVSDSAASSRWRCLHRWVSRRCSRNQRQLPRHPAIPVRLRCRRRVPCCTSSVVPCRPTHRTLAPDCQPTVSADPAETVSAVPGPDCDALRLRQSDSSPAVHPDFAGPASEPLHRPRWGCSYRGNPAADQHGLFRQDQCPASAPAPYRSDHYKDPRMSSFPGFQWLVSWPRCTSRRPVPRVPSGGPRPECLQYHATQ